MPLTPAVLLAAGAIFATVTRTPAGHLPPSIAAPARGAARASRARALWRRRWARGSRGGGGGYSRGHVRDAHHAGPRAIRAQRLPLPPPLGDRALLGC